MSPSYLHIYLLLVPFILECLLFLKNHDSWLLFAVSLDIQEYIEAPMWADLTLESKSGGEDTWVISLYW